MNLFSLENLLITISCITLAFFIAKYAENNAHRIWAIFNCVVALWSFGSLLAGISKFPEQALLNWKIAYLGITFIPILFYHFVYAYYILQRKAILILFYLFGIFSCTIILFTNICLNEVFWAFNSFYYIKATFFSNLWWGTWCLITIYTFFEFEINIKNDDKRRIPSLIIFWGMLIGFIGGLSNLLPEYGIMIYPAYQITVCLYAILIAYGIFYHRLLPIDIVIKRSIIYSLLVAVISLTYILSVLISQQIFRQYFGYSSTIISSIIIAIAFIPLKNKIQDLVDKFFLKATPLEMAQQNEKLRQEITQAERMKSIALLASGMAHEIKNPLTPIKTFSEILPSRLDDKEFLLKFSRIISKEVDRIDSLVQELLIFAKPSPPELKEVNIHQLIAQTLDYLNNDIIRHKIQLNISFENKNILVQLDPKQFKQALLNIFLNAIDAMPNGGTLTIDSRPCKKNNPKLIISISDSGCGIAPKDLPYIFEPFFSKKEKGTGLGLAITQGIIENNRGKICVESALNKGTKFIIEIPLKIPD